MTPLAGEPWTTSPTRASPFGRFGLKVRTGAAGEETVLGYDATTQELYVDRTRSGAADFNSSFPGVRTAPLKAGNDKVQLRIRPLTRTPDREEDPARRIHRP